jgi:hypothetical protein
LSQIGIEVGVAVMRCHFPNLDPEITWYYNLPKLSAFQISISSSS